MPFLLDVSNIFADKVANRWRVNLPYQVRSKYKASVQRDHYV
jgi:hypothetical protein